MILCPRAVPRGGTSDEGKNRFRVPGGRGTGAQVSGNRFQVSGFDLSAAKRLARPAAAGGPSILMAGGSLVTALPAASGYSRKYFAGLTGVSLTITS